MNAPLEIIEFGGMNGKGALPVTATPGIEVKPIANGVQGARVVDSTSPLNGHAPGDDPDALKREMLLQKLRDDRADLVKVANKVREIAETVETAQITLAFTRRGLRFALLAGSAAALTYWLTNGRRSRTTLFAGLSMQVMHRWLKPASRKLPPPNKSRLPAPRARVV